MSSIPLPALAVKPPEPNDALGSFQKLMALKSMGQQQQIQQQQLAAGQQEQQIRQQQIADQQATTAALKNWDGKDYDSLAKDVLKNGGSANAATAIQQHGLNIRKTVSDIAKQDAEAGSKNLETFIGQHKAVGDTLEGLLKLPDEQLPAAAMQSVQQLAQAGVMDPQAAQKAAQLIQSTQDPKALRQQIDITAKTAMGAKAAAEQAKTEAETAASNAIAEQKRQESEWYAKNGGAPGVPSEAVERSDWLRKNPGRTASDYVVWKAQHSPSVILQGGAGGGPNGDPMVDMVGQGRVDLTTATQRMSPMAKNAFMKQLDAKYPGYNQAEYGVTKKVQEEFTSGDAAKNLTAFNTAIEHAGQLSKAADALKNGDMRGLNKIGNALGYQFGSDATTNFGVIKSALSGEISKVFKGGQATDAEIRDVQAPFDAANSPEQLQGAIKSAITLMNSKRDALKQQYEAGKQGKPNFGGESGSAFSVKAPNGKTYTFKDQQSADAFKKRAGID